MGRLNFQYRCGEDMPQEIELLISILLRYPEICSIRYIPEDYAIKLQFMILGNHERLLTNKLRDAIEVFHRLEGQVMKTCNIELSKEGNFTILTVLRDVKSMSKSEVGLIVKLLKTELNSKLIYDELQLSEDELVTQDKVINEYFESIEKSCFESDLGKSFIAVREEGKVFVYNR